MSVGVAIPIAPHPALAGRSELGGAMVGAARAPANARCHAGAVPNWRDGGLREFLLLRRSAWHWCSLGPAGQPNGRSRWRTA